MKQWKQTLRSRRGDTMIEVIISAVIVLAAIGVFVTCALAAGRINARIAAQDAAMYEEIAAAEGRDGTAQDATLSLSAAGNPITDLSVKIYGENMKSFDYIAEVNAP